MHSFEAEDDYINFCFKGGGGGGGGILPQTYEIHLRVMFATD